MKNDSGCLLLAGGAGKRMGGFNKMNLTLNGRTFGDRIIRELEKTGLKCFLSTAQYDIECPAGWIKVKDDVRGVRGEYTGPIGGLYTCLKEAACSGLKGLFTVPCDIPLFESRIFEELEKKLDADRIAVMEAGGKIQYLCGYYPVSSLPLIEEAVNKGKYRIKDVIRLSGACVIAAKELGVRDELLENINTPEELDLKGTERRSWEELR